MTTMIMYVDEGTYMLRQGSQRITTKESPLGDRQPWDSLQISESYCRPPSAEDAGAKNSFLPLVWPILLGPLCCIAPVSQHVLYLLSCTG
jgi:hypothetical protein